MPSRPIVVLILAFWSVTLGVAFYRDVWPHLNASGPPPMAVDLADEASQNLQVRWSVLRGKASIGTLRTSMKYVEDDDTFRLTHKYTRLRFDFPGFRGLGIPDVRIELPDLTTTTRVSREGHLREQTMTGTMNLLMEQGGKFVTVAEASAEFAGRVEGGVFRGRCNLESPLFKVQRDLDPVPVPQGQALNPLQPLNRIAGIHPGQRWVVHKIDPLEEALAALFQEQLGKHGFAVPKKKEEPLIAQVSSEPEALRWGKGDAEVMCWVIDYRGGDARAKTWVRASDGKVLRQEATMNGEMLALVRED
jgi:hypothetical protein